MKRSVIRERRPRISLRYLGFTALPATFGQAYFWYFLLAPRRAQRGHGHVQASFVACRLVLVDDALGRHAIDDGDGGPIGGGGRVLVFRLYRPRHLLDGRAQGRPPALVMGTAFLGLACPFAGRWRIGQAMKSSTVREMGRNYAGSGKGCQRYLLIGVARSGSRDQRPEWGRKARISKGHFPMVSWAVVPRPWEPPPHEVAR